jgi:hypothetical protein
MHSHGFIAIVIEQHFVVRDAVVQVEIEPLLERLPTRLASLVEKVVLVIPGGTGARLVGDNRSAVRLEVIVDTLHLLQSFGRSVPLGDVVDVEKSRLPGDVAVGGRVEALAAHVVDVPVKGLAAQFGSHVEVRVETVEDVAGDLGFALEMVRSGLLVIRPLDILLDSEGQFLLVRLEALGERGWYAGHSCGGTCRPAGGTLGATELRQD